MSEYLSPEGETLDELVEEGALTAAGTPRCQVCTGQYGRNQCPYEGYHVAVTTMIAPVHLQIRVCGEHAAQLIDTPGWGVRA